MFFILYNFYMQDQPNLPWFFQTGILSNFGNTFNSQFNENENYYKSISFENAAENNGA